MDVFDHINQRIGKGSIQYAAEGFQSTGSSKQTWQMNRALLSPRATTRWDELLSVN